MAKKTAIAIIGIVVTLTIFLGFALPKIAFNYDFEKFFKPREGSFDFYENHKNHFGTDDDFVLIAVVNHNGVFDSGFLQDVKSLSAQLNTLPHVKQVIAPTDLTYSIRESVTGAVFHLPVLSGNRHRDSLRVYSDPWLINRFFSGGVPAINILIYTDRGLSKAKSDELAREISKTIAEYRFDEIHITGRAIVQKVYLEKIQKEFAFFFAAAVVLVVVILFLIFRSFSATLIPVVTVGIGLVCTLGIVSLWGKKINILLSMLPPIIFVVGINNTVHLYTRWAAERKKNIASQTAIKNALSDTGLAIFLTAITTSIGFGSLYFTGIPVLQDFGLVVAIGVMTTFVVSVTFLPAWLALLKPAVGVKKSFLSEPFLNQFLTHILKKRKMVLISAFALMALFLWAITGLRMDNFIFEDLKPDDPTARDFVFFEENFSGVRPFEMGLKLKDEAASFLDWENLEALEKIEEYLEKSYGVSSTYSVLNLVREVNRMHHGGKNEYYKLPFSGNEYARIEKELQRPESRRLLATVLAEDGSYARITGRTRDMGAGYFKNAGEAFYTFAEKAHLLETMTIEITGTGMRIDKTHQNLVRNLTKGLVAAIVLISAVMGVVFKSLKMMVAALIPNILPLVAIGGVMALSGINLNMSTGIIFTIIFGIAVDDTIHILSRYRLAMRDGLSKNEAFRTAYTQTGRAVIATSAILFAGFMVFYFSTFQSIALVGLLVGIALVFALIFDMVLLPVLVAGVDENDGGLKKSE